MNTSPNATSRSSLISVWYKIGAVVVLMVIVVLFLVFAGVIGRRRMNNEVPPGGTVPGQPNPVFTQ
jgi:hypothetical protein